MGTRKTRKKMLLTRKPMLKTAFFSDELFVAEDVVEAEADVATAMSLSKPVQLDRHVVINLVILLLMNKLATKKKPMLTEKPRLKKLTPDAHFADEAEVVVDAATETMSLSKLAQLDLHVATSLAILLTRKKRKKMLTKKP